MTNDQAITKLRVLRLQLNDNIARVGRKRSWRLSEKAMTCAKFREQIQALDMAIAALGGNA